MFLQNDYNKNTAKTSFRKLFMNSKLFQNKVSKCRTYLLLIHKKKGITILNIFSSCNHRYNYEIIAVKLGSLLNIP